VTMTTWFWPWRARRGSESTQTAKSKPAITSREATGYPLETRTLPPSPSSRDPPGNLP
jgi:hypothetical protein